MHRRPPPSALLPEGFLPVTQTHMRVRASAPSGGGLSGWHTAGQGENGGGEPDRKWGAGVCVPPRAPRRPPHTSLEEGKGTSSGKGKADGFPSEPGRACQGGGAGSLPPSCRQRTAPRGSPTPSLRRRPCSLLGLVAAGPARAGKPEEGGRGRDGGKRRERRGGRTSGLHPRAPTAFSLEPQWPDEDGDSRWARRDGPCTPARAEGLVCLLQAGSQALGERMAQSQAPREGKMQFVGNHKAE